MTRGEIVVAVSGLDGEPAATARLRKLPLNRINPFRLIGIFPTTQHVVEWRWDLKRLTRTGHRWETQQWISSGFDEPAAQRIRCQTFRAVQRQHSAGSLRWLRQLHCSHSPEAGAFSTCMHRADAATVSYTEIAVSSLQATMRYHAGTPCQNCKPAIYRIQLGNRESYDNSIVKICRACRNATLVRIEQGGKGLYDVVAKKCEDCNLDDTYVAIAKQHLPFKEQIKR